VKNLVTCPHCAGEFPIDEVLSTQFAATIRGELEEEFSKKTQRLVAEREKVAAHEKQLETRVEQFDGQVEEAVAKQRKAIETQAKAVAQQAVAIDLKERDERLEDLLEKQKTFEKQELQLRRKARELEEQAQQQELKIARQMDEERLKIRQEALRQADEQNQLKQAEHQLVIESMKKQIDTLKRKAEQGSQQTQGEVQEIALEALLSNQFPGDVIEPVAKGVRGGDTLHRVFDSLGRDCGTILWESKRTKNWSDKWLSKAVDDQQEAKASCVCIVSTAMPGSVDYVGDLDGVWIASWPCARSAAIVLRSILIETTQARSAADGQNGKMERVYQYLSGPEFRNRVRGLVGPYDEMQADLNAEKRAINKQWNKRQKQLDRALASTTGLYGDLEGIIGGDGLQEIEGMDLLAIDVDEIDTDEEAPTPTPAN